MKPKVKIVLFVVVLLAIAGVGAGFYLFNLKAKDLAREKSDYVLNAADLQKSFEENESSAEEMYVNKIVEVTGEIVNISHGENGSLLVSLKTGSDLSSVICSFAESSAIGNFAAGDKITVRGECSGYLMDVLLNNCVTIKK